MIWTSLNSALTREQAAQMAFNAVTARMVDYTGGTNITTPDGTTIVVDADRYYVGHTRPPVIAWMWPTTSTRSSASSMLPS